MQNYESNVSKVRDVANVMDVIRQYVDLKPSGPQSSKACCPFHLEKSASFFVHGDKNFYFCFGCGAKGDSFDFLTKYAAMSFSEAMDWLAGYYGLTLEEGEREFSEFERYQIKQKEMAAKLQRLEQRLEQKALAAPKTPRGIELDLPSSFLPLTHPDVAAVAEYAVGQRNFPMKLFQDYGFFGCMEGKYAQRLIIPCRENGKVVFWQGRDITGEHDRRYDGPCISSSQYLFNVDAAAQYEFTVICEGVFSAMRTGPFAVATYGNKISDAQISLLQSRNVTRVLLLYDADSWRIHPNLLLQGHTNPPPPPIMKAMAKLMGQFQYIYVKRLLRGDPDDVGTARIHTAIQSAVRITSYDQFLDHFNLRGFEQP